ncbi:MAG TPA: TerB family tellurite resistance protein [Myxococcota bacterium]|nr:TerB family tellurite resistance protein [Myxococcota bacterium]
MLASLAREERLRLMKFVCAFAWADLEVQSEERAFVHRMVARLGLGPDESAQVDAWLRVPPRIDDVDPVQIPREHRKLFLDTLRELVLADGAVDEQEQASLALLEDLLAGAA